jgi:5-methylcytosine-specific restriction endonuclease McrA
MEKKCTKCKVTQPVENFYWRKTRNNYSPKCKPCWTEDSKTYNIQNKEARTEYYNKWRENNDDWKKYQRDYKKKSSPQQRVIFNLRNRVYKLMLKEYKSQATLDLIGCSREEFLLHLEKQFTKEMNWENYGTYWEVDHIIPLSKGGTIRWDNSRPYLISDNRKKYNKMQ